MERNCRNCQKEFRPHRRSQKFCSPSCTQHVRWTRARGKKKKCVVCDKEFIAIFDRRVTCKTCGDRLGRIRWKMKNQNVIVSPEKILELLRVKVCDICGRPNEDKKDLAFDHEGTMIRGRLCRRHNTALGLFGEDPELLRKAADYIERARAQRT